MSITLFKFQSGPRCDLNVRKDSEHTKTPSIDSRIQKFIFYNPFLESQKKREKETFEMTQLL